MVEVVRAPYEVWVVCGSPLYLVVYVCCLFGKHKDYMLEKIMGFPSILKAILDRVTLCRQVARKSLAGAQPADPHLPRVLLCYCYCAHLVYAAVSISLPPGEKTAGGSCVTVSWLR